MEPKLSVGVDAGGTFTDFAFLHDGKLAFLKVPSTPDDPSRAVLEGLSRLEANLAGIRVVHGSTVATNALIERRGGPAALVTTAGFEDLIEIGRQARPDLYDWNAIRPDPLVSRRMRFGVRERSYAARSPRERVRPNHRERLRIMALGRRLSRLGIRSVAVCFLHSYRDGRNERAAALLLRRAGLTVTVSHALVAEYREYERFSTACANAYLQPVVSDHLRRLRSRLRGRLRVIKSSGLAAPASILSNEPVHSVLSGPAGGVLAAQGVARRLGIANVIAFDMGGTSTDVALIPGEVPFTVQTRIAGIPLTIPCIAVETVGAGGGSIARVDEGGALRVGPESAGADPGPACYGRGDLPTVTDANLLLGRIGRSELLGGELTLEPARAERALSRLGRALRLDARETAEGVIEIANASMERALRSVSLQRGYDPREFTLVCYGGAGGLHCCGLADVTGIRRIVLPVSPGTFSALGMILAPEGRDESQTVLLSADALSNSQLEKLFRDLEARASRALTRAGGMQDGVAPGAIVFERTADLRYRGQSHELTVPARGGIVRNFRRRYEDLYGEPGEGLEIEIVTLRVRARGPVPKLPRIARAGGSGKPRADHTSRVVIAGRAIEVPAYRREALGAGARIVGPARILEYSSTTLLPAHWGSTTDAEGNLHLEKVR